MFSAAQKSKIIEWRTCSDIKIGIIPPESLPESYTLSQIHRNLCISETSNNDEGVLRNILILSACLRQSEKLSREDGDDAFITQISMWLSEAIIPTSSLIPTSGNRIPDKVLKLARQKGVAGLLIFEACFPKLYKEPPQILDPQILLSLIAFSSLHDPWATSYSTAIANNLLSEYQHQTRTSAFIIDFTLQQFIRPLFSKSKRPEAITASGRKAMPSSAPPRRFDASATDPVNLPWMYEVPHAVAAFEWAVANSTTEIAAPSFNLYLPPLLTLLDSTNTTTRSRALGILANFLLLLPQKLLIQTGLAEVFEDAITPTLMFLPNLTPVDESVPLLEGAYGCLIKLGDVLYEQKEAENTEEKEMKYWDRLMRKGVLMGYAHSSEHPAIANVLVQSMGKLVAKMGVHAVKYLKDIIPILSTTLTDPFIPSHPSLLLTTLNTLQTTIENCWPRLSEARHRIEIITALTVCWKNVTQAPNKPATDLKAAKKVLCVTSTMLVEAVDGDEEVDIRGELEKLFNVDPGLRMVFGLAEKVS